MYIMGTLLKHGSKDQKQKYLPGIASGDIRLQAFGVTEDTWDSGYIINGQKITSRAEYSDLLLLLARTTPIYTTIEHIQPLNI